MSVSSISLANKNILWGKSAGRCQYRGCNTSLYLSDLTKAEFNQSYIAHIVADVPGGPRGHATRSDLLKDDLSNLMLLCDQHHRLIDKVDVSGHPESLLLEMKKEHEDRVEKVTSIGVNMHSHILIYRANVGTHTPEISYETARKYLLPNRYPAMSSAIDLGLTNSPQRDKNDSFWSTELENLTTQFEEQIRPKLRKGEVKHLSIFGFAPMPLLIKLGTLINDIHDAEIHQPVRSPKTWNLDDANTTTEYKVVYPTERHPTVALNISLSATINNDRIHDVLGDKCSIYTITIDSPFNDFLKSKKQLQDFSVVYRKLLNKMKADYGSATPVHIFPAMPIAVAIEMGRVWMPKADMSLFVYDENTANSGFFKALEIINT